MPSPELDLVAVNSYVSGNIDRFHTHRLRLLEKLTLNALLTKNPYLFRAKNVLYAQEFIEDLLGALLPASEERAFGGFLEDLAIFVSKAMKGAWKSGIPGIDLEFIEDQKHYLVSVKSGPKWGNSSQQSKQAANFEKAVGVSNNPVIKSMSSQSWASVMAGRKQAMCGVR